MMRRALLQSRQQQTSVLGRLGLVQPSRALSVQPIPTHEEIEITHTPRAPQQPQETSFKTEARVMNGEKAVLRNVSVIWTWKLGCPSAI